jgi:hypothetical protein
MWRIRTRNEDVTWSLFLKAIVSVIRQWIHWIWKTFLYWILLSNELLVECFDFFFIVNLLISSFEMKSSCAFAFKTRKNREDNDYHSRLWMSFFMREIMRFSCEKWLFFTLSIVKRSLRSIQSSDRVLCVISSEIHRKRSSFMNEKCCKS